MENARIEMSVREECLTVSASPVVTLLALPSSRPDSQSSASDSCDVASVTTPVRQYNPKNMGSGGDVRYISILAPKDEIEERLKSYQLNGVLVQEQTPEADTAKKRRRKNERPTRPPKKILPAKSGSCLLNGMETSHAMTTMAGQPSLSMPTNHTINSPSPPSDSLFYAEGANSNTMQMQQLLAAVRQSFTGSLCPDQDFSKPVGTSIIFHHFADSSKSPPTGSSFSFSSPMNGFLSSPVRLPSIGEFLRSSSPQSRMTSPFRYQPVNGDWNGSQVESSPCAVGGRPDLSGVSVSPSHRKPFPGSSHENTPTTASLGQTSPVQSHRKRRSCSMDAASILASVSIPRSVHPSIAKFDSSPSRAVSTAVASQKTTNSAGDSYPDMPDALPVRASVSPFSTITDPSDPALGASLPPPLSVTIDEEQKSIRLRIKTSVWNASSSTDSETVSTGDTKDGETIQPSKPMVPLQNGHVSPSRVKKKVVKFSPPDTKKTPPSVKCSSSPSKPPLRRRGRPPLSASSGERTNTVKSSLPSVAATKCGSVGKITCKDLLADISSPESAFAAARFETLDIRAKFDKMPAVVQCEIMRSLPKSWTIVANDSTTSLKPGVFTKGDGKFRQHLARWQSNLAAGEYDTQVRRRFIDLAVGNLDPWKVQNFEPVYGDIMTSKCQTNGASASSTDTLTCNGHNPPILSQPSSS